MAPEYSEEELRGLFGQLSERQLEVLRFLAAHQTAKEIARTLGISEHTIRAHATEVRRRLGTSNIREASILLGRFEGMRPLVSNWQPQSVGIAVETSISAGLVHEPDPDPHLEFEDCETRDAQEADAVGASAVRIEPDPSFAAAYMAVGDDRGSPRGLAWVYLRLRSLSNAKWLALTGAATFLILLMTAGILAGAGAILQTLQEISIRAR